MQLNTRKVLFCYLPFIVLFILAILVRTLWLGNIPGINGDESWYGLQVVGNNSISWFTPTGNPLNPFYIIPLWLFHQIFPPAFWVLRLPAVFAGLSLVLLGYLLLRKQFGMTTALVFSSICAGLPDLIVYSRIGWDACETGLAMLVVFFLAFSGRWWLCIIAEIAAIIIHPSNVLALVFLFFLFGEQHYHPVIGSKHRIKILALSIFLCILLSLFFLQYLDYVGIIQISSGIVAHRLLNPSGWLGLFSAFGDLISGISVYRLIVGPVPIISLMFHNLAIWVAFLPIIALGCWYSIKHKSYRIISLVFGIIASLVVIYLAFGFEEIFIDRNRYSQFLVVPTILLLSLSINEIFSETKYRWQPIGLALMLGFLGIFSFMTNYFLPLFATGGNSSHIYFTGSIEPKAAAAGIIMEGNTSGKQTMIITEDWWVGLPVEYLLTNHPEFSFLQFDAFHPDNTEIKSIMREGGYAVGFFQGALEKTMTDIINDPPLGKIVVFGYSEKPILVIWHVLPFPHNIK
jgi:hypothetical protein